MKPIILIPARYNSSRFTGKPLTMLGGIPMIRRVYDTCISSGYDTCVLTDSYEIAKTVPCSDVFYEKKDYKNGTERCAGAITDQRFSDYDSVINVQGDMPDVTTDMISKIATMIEKHRIVTLYTKLDEEKQSDKNTVKMINSIPNKIGYSKVNWFGRGITGYGDHHLGVYGYRKNVLVKYSNMKVPDEENQESLEQLRWLQNGFDIYSTCVRFKGIEINTPEDSVLWNQKNSV